MAQTITGVFPDPEHAQAAVRELVSIGVDRDDIEVMTGTPEGGNDRHVNTQAVGQGQTVVTVPATDAQMESVGMIFERHGATDVSPRPEAIARARAELAEIPPSATETVHFADRVPVTQVSEDPIQEVVTGRQNR